MRRLYGVPALRKHGPLPSCRGLLGTYMVDMLILLAAFISNMVHLMPQRVALPAVKHQLSDHRPTTASQYMPGTYERKIGIALLALARARHVLLTVLFNLG